MRKTKKIKIKTERVKTTDIICNNCGKSCKGKIGNYNGLIEAEISGAFDSPKLDDMFTYTFSLCENCLTKLFKKFKIQPEIKEQKHCI